MSQFESMWDGLASIRDEAVDEILGDRINYRIAGGRYKMIPGFVVDETSPISTNEIDYLTAVVHRIKVSKALVPAPSPDDRIQHPRLGEGTFAPGGDQPETQGRYWIFDVQRVSTNL